MFVERLTEEQIKSFIEEQYDEDHFEYEFAHIKKREIITATVKILYDSDEHDNFWLLDFEVAWSNSQNIEEEWIKYLYKIFGEEYKEAYLAECAKIFE